MKTTKKLIPIAEYKDEEGNIQWDKLVGKTVIYNSNNFLKEMGVNVPLDLTDQKLVDTIVVDDDLFLKFERNKTKWCPSKEYHIIGVIESESEIEPEKKKDAYNWIEEWRKAQPPTKKPRYDEPVYPHRSVNPYPHYPFGPNYPNTPWNPLDPNPYWKQPQPYCREDQYITTDKTTPYVPEIFSTGTPFPQVGQSISTSGINNTCCGSKE